MASMGEAMLVFYCVYYKDPEFARPRSHNRSRWSRLISSPDVKPEQRH